MVTLESLLNQMVNPTALTWMSSPSYAAKSATSYDRASVTNNPLDGLYIETEGRDWGKGWFANHDFGFVIREEETEGRIEKVLMEDHGPGALVRWWITSMDRGVIRVYLDGAEAPVIEMAPNEIIGGDGLTGYPFSFLASDEHTEPQWRGRNLYLPIPYQKGCRVTLEDSPKYLYYQIQYRSYSPGTRVTSFSMDQLEQARETISRAGAELISTQSPVSGARVVQERGVLASGDSMVLTANGGGAIGLLRVRLTAPDYQQALRSTVVSMRFDGEDTGWIPIGALCGVGYSAEKNDTRFARVDPDSRTLESFYLMPFRKDAAISLTNYGNHDVTIDSFELEIRDYTWASDSLHFHATWFEQRNLDTCRRRDMNFVTVRGAGRYVGTSVTVFNTDPQPEGETWWGEGDEKIYVDGESFPSIFGTGTEDYFNYAWCRPQRFYNPFGSQPRGEGNKKWGYTNNNRYHILDDVPFTASFRFDMELWHPFREPVNYAAATFFFAAPGAVCNRIPAPEAVAHGVALHRDDVLSVTGEPHQSPMQVYVVVRPFDSEGTVQGSRVDVLASERLHDFEHDVLLWDGNRADEPADLYWRKLSDDTVSDHGFEIGFASKLRDRNINRHFAIITCSAPVSDHLPVVETVCRALIAMENEHINWDLAGIVWMSAEGDPDSPDSSERTVQCERFIEALRRDFASPGLPIIECEDPGSSDARSMFEVGEQCGEHMSRLIADRKNTGGESHDGE